MSNGWIDARRFSFNALLLMDRWIFRNIAGNRSFEFQKNLGTALAGNPVVFWYILNKCPETAGYYRSLAEAAPAKPSAEEIRECETWVLEALDWAVVYILHYISKNGGDVFRYWKRKGRAD